MHISRMIAGLLFAAFFFPGLASATRLYFDTNGNIIGHDVTDKYPGSRSAAPTGVNSHVGGTSRVPLPGGGKLPVPVNATIPLSKAAVAKAAGKRAAAAALGGPAGAAFTAAAVAEELLDPGNDSSGWAKCGFMDLFLCKVVPGSGGSPTLQYGYSKSSVWYWGFSTALAACQDAGTKSSFTLTNLRMATATQCHGDSSQYGTVGVATIFSTSLCADGTAPDTSKPLNEQCGPVVPSTEVPATEAEIELSLQEKMDADYEAARRLVDAMHKDMEAAGANYPTDHSPYKADTPVDVDAPPVTSPERTTKTETIPQPDGSVDTRTTKEKTTVTPERTGTNLGDTQVKFPSQTTITTTTVNNVTNNTTTSVTTVNNPAPEDSDNEDYSFVDSTMPQVPELYTQKYPNGIAGVWADHKPNIQGTQFWAGIQQMFPSFGTGQCPAWSMSFNLGAAGNYGTIPFNVPCWIFQAIGLILMTTAAFTARKIIF
jgi:hypothetical protein